jgi:RNA polymerase sigma-70 factor, ECF subfamily
VNLSLNQVDTPLTRKGGFAWSHQCSIFKIVDTASSHPGDIVLPLPSAQQATDSSREAPLLVGLPLSMAQELWLTAEAETCGLTFEEFSTTLGSVGAKLNYGFPPGVHADAAQKSAFFRALHLPELALAHACALGHEAAWRRFLGLYRSLLTQAAIAITGSATLGHDLADSLYSELYGLKQHEGERHSPLASYSGRGSLLSWLRAILAQRHVDHHRRTHRETALDTLDIPVLPLAQSPAPAELTQLTHAVARTLQALPPEDRFLLSTYFLDRQTLLQIARILQVHEATVSRRLKRLVADLRKRLLYNLQSGGLSKRASEEALGTDPRDIEINLRTILQTSQLAPFSDKANSAPTTESDQP